MYNDCYATCGVAAKNCKNKYCSANPNYVPPQHKVKAKQGSGNPTTKPSANIPHFKDIFPDSVPNK